ncbi:MAG: redoxin domain-containing protein [Gemmatimonadetes bacterium]|nr:redoxin domain-containing protein [Gemmatimonadota bacterium]
MSVRIPLGVSIVALLAGVGPASGQGRRALGPKDGPLVPATNLERVKLGDAAPDFTLAALDGRVITLSEYRDRKNVVLVFYRGHW